MGPHFFIVHVSSAQWSDHSSAVRVSPCKYDEQVTPLLGPPDRAESLLDLGMPGVPAYQRRSGEETLYFRDRNAVLLTLVEIAAIPSEPVKSHRQAPLDLHIILHMQGKANSDRVVLSERGLSLALPTSAIL
jgi:hypothetical protein